MVAHNHRETWGGRKIDSRLGIICGATREQESTKLHPIPPLDRVLSISGALGFAALLMQVNCPQKHQVSLRKSKVA